MDDEEGKARREGTPHRGKKGEGETLVTREQTG